MDRTELGQQIVAHLPALRRFARSLCRSPDNADDLVQSACERALAGAERFDEGTRLDAWMFRIIRNLWIDQLRRGRTAGRQEDIADHPDAASSDPAPEIEGRSQLRRVWDAMQNLADEQREVLLLVCVEELSYKEAAVVLDLPIGTVMSRLARARKNLAEASGIEAAPARSSGKGEDR
jgi:RNA polymerase sigma-70 factor (ECF subfamily)